MATRRFVIVGGGLAGAKTAEALREQGFDGEVVVLGAEADPPYDRPPLSKDYLQGKTGRDTIFVHEPAWYASHDVQLRTATRVTGIHRGTHQVTVDGGEQLGYDKLLLATGSTPRRLSVPGQMLDGVHCLRTLADSDRVRAAIGAGGRLVIVGAGWIGLEVAAVARSAGVEVTVLARASLPLQRALGPEMGAVFADLHREHGVDLRLETELAEITGDRNQVTGVRLADGTGLDATAVLIAVGASPDTAVAQRAGLAVGDGVVVDPALRSSDPDIFAAGDIARVAPRPYLQTTVRVEHWANALNQPATAAAAMLGKPASFDALPYFFTDQYDVGMEYVGYVGSDGYDQVVVRGDVSAGEFIAFWTRDERVLAGMNVNIWGVTDSMKALIHADTPIDPDELADPQVPLEALVPAYRATS